MRTSAESVKSWLTGSPVLFCRVLAWTKQRGADPDDGGALFDGDVEVAAHAHAQVRQGRAELLLALLLQLAQLLKNRTHLFRFGSPGRDGHETMNFDTRQGVDLLQLGHDLLWLETKFGS